MTGDRQRFGLIGFGRIGRRLATLLPGSAHAPDLARVLVRPDRRAGAAADVGDDRVATSIEAFLEDPPDVVVECGSAAALAAFGPSVLAAGADLIPLSLAALADRHVEALLLSAAEAGPGRLEIPAGAVGALDFLAAAREDDLRDVVFRAAYPVERWRGTAAETLIDLDAVRTPALFLRTSVRDAVALFPRHINVAVGVALAGLGLDATRAELIADPALTQATFEVEAQAGPGAALLRIGGRDAPLGADPVDYTTFSLMRLLRRRQARVMI